MVELPKPDVAGMSMIGMVMEPIPALAVIPIEVVGPPTVIAAVGKVILMVGMMMGVKSILFSAATMVKPWRVTTPASMLMGICIGMSTPKVRAISGIASAACKPMRP
ncbi:Uncharacterised protein [Mycobacterium tuberculosis]|nr:Uncharacterised protein [Mycobacterium tuberculosis]